MEQWSLGHFGALEKLFTGSSGKVTRMTNRLSKLTQKGRKFLPKKRQVKGSIVETVKKEVLKFVKGLKIEE